MTAITFPYPPSVNQYWRMFVAGKLPRMILSKQGREYQKATQWLWLQAGHRTMTGRLIVKITAYMPDNRTRDLDNICKAVLDGLVNATAFENDSQIDDLRIVRGGVDKANPRVEIQVEAAS